jgi:hypothetical protein
MPGSPDQGKGYLRDGEGFGHAKHRGGRCKRGLEDGISRLREGATFLTSELRLVAPSTLPCRAAGRGWVPRVPRPAAPVTSATITQRAVTFHGHETATPDRSHGRDCCATQGLDRASMRSRLYPRARSLLLSPDGRCLLTRALAAAGDDQQQRTAAGLLLDASSAARYIAGGRPGPHSCATSDGLIAWRPQREPGGCDRGASFARRQGRKCSPPSAGASPAAVHLRAAFGRARSSRRSLVASCRPGAPQG